MRVCRSCLVSLSALRAPSASASVARRTPLRKGFHSSRCLDIVKPFLLADIGEGTRECQIIQWFVQPGARVEQFDKLCEVQSDKTATDITSPFDGVIKKLHYEADDMAIVGKPLVDIDIQSELSPQDEAKLGGSSSKPEAKDQDAKMPAPDMMGDTKAAPITTTPTSTTAPRRDSPHRSLATPAVRHLSKELKVNIEDIEGTGKDGRVTKEDVQRFASGQSSTPSTSTSTQSQSTPATAPLRATGEDRKVPLTPVQTAMFKTMTRSMTIPHFLYTMTVDMTPLTALRQRINASRDKSQRITPLAFILKAVSQAFSHHPLLNASLNTTGDKPELTYRASHHFGIAVDTPTGLLVPVIRDVQAQSVGELAASIRAASEKASAGKLVSADLQGATFTVSNIGSIGGGVVAPIIVEPQVGIVGVGRSRVVPAFDETGAVVQKEELVLSWSADHRVVDGAECARTAEKVKRYLERVDEWVLEMR